MIKLYWSRDEKCDALIKMKVTPYFIIYITQFNFVIHFVLHPLGNILQQILFVHQSTYQNLIQSNQIMIPLTRSVHCFSKADSIKLPERVGVLGYGAIGKAFVDILLQNHPKAKVSALDKTDQYAFAPKKLDRHVFHVNRNNYKQVPDLLGLRQGDFLVDLSTNIEFLSMWPECSSRGLRYLNTALEQWEDGEDATSYPKNADEAYKLTLGFIKDEAKNKKHWTSKGPTTLLEMGFNPGLVSLCVKKGLEDCAAHYLKTTVPAGVDTAKLKQYLKARNHSKLAQELGVHTIHCSEIDKQVLDQTPADSRTKFYNTWSCRGFLTEGMVPIQVARGSHEDQNIPGTYLLRNGQTLVSKEPSVRTVANSWVPCENIKGVLIPHGEAYSIQDYLRDPETGYAPSQYYVYDYNIYAKHYIQSLPANADVHNTNPEMEVIHPMNHPSLQGADKVGAFLIMNGNRGWWTGSIMDETDCKPFFNGKYGPTVLQVAAGVYAGFMWACKKPKAGCNFPDHTDTDFILKTAMPYLGRFISMGVDLSNTSIKDCHKLQSFLIKQ